MFSKKLEDRLEKLETTVSGLYSIMKMSIKCEDCGEPAMYCACRRYVDTEDGRAIEDSLLCDECLKKREK